MFPTQTAQTLPFGPFFTWAHTSKKKKHLRILLFVFEIFPGKEHKFWQLLFLTRVRIFRTFDNMIERYSETVYSPAVEISLSIIGDFSLKETAFVSQILDVRNVRRTIRVRSQEGYKEENRSEGP